MANRDYKLAILSRDAMAYEKNITLSLPANVSIISCTETPDSIEGLEQIDILLAEPDLAADVADKLTNLKWIQSTWAGIKPLVKFGNRDFQVTGVKDVFGPQMREYVLAYMLYFSRQIPQFQSLQSSRHWHQPDTEYLFNKTVGIMGVGSIGKSVAGACKTLGMKVLGVSNSSRDCEFVDTYYDLTDLSAFASQLDFLVCLLPHTVQTDSLIDAAFLNQLPAHCVLINAGRGQVICDDDLINAIDNGNLKAAVLDVFDIEPLPDDHPYWSNDNVFITQHTAAISKVEDISNIFTENCRLFLSGKQMSHIVDLNKGY